MGKIKRLPITYYTIGIIRTPFTESKKPPPQGIYDPESRGCIEIYPEFVSGLKDLEGFSHLILLFHFHLSEGYDLQCYPRGDQKLRGVFATRSPRRPNPVGCSVVRLLKIEENRLEVKQIDMYDGTPLLDIKPYIPPFDLVGWPNAKVKKEVRLGWLTERIRREMREGLLGVDSKEEQLLKF